MSETGILATSNNVCPLTWTATNFYYVQHSTRLLNSIPQHSNPASRLESGLLGHPVTSSHSQARDSCRLSAGGDSVGPGRKAFPGLLALITWRG